MRITDIRTNYFKYFGVKKLRKEHIDFVSSQIKERVEPIVYLEPRLQDEFREEKTESLDCLYYSSSWIYNNNFINLGFVGAIVFALNIFFLTINPGIYLSSGTVFIVAQLSLIVIVGVVEYWRKGERFTYKVEIVRKKV